MVSDLDPSESLAHTSLVASGETRKVGKASAEGSKQAMVAGRASAGSPPQKPNVGRLRSQLDVYMAEQGLRSTGQRRAIIDMFFAATGHATIEDLLERVRKVDSGIGYATVYRTMKMLAAGGIANEHKFSDGMTRYELADEDAHHDHLICVHCGRIQEFEEPLIEELQDRIAARYGFTIVDHKHELYGFCSNPECAAKRRTSSAP